MDRHMGREWTQLWRRLSPRYIRMITMFFLAFVLFNAAMYFSIQVLFYPYQPTSTTETTVTTTTTTATTSLETTTTEEPPFLGCFFDRTNITLADGSVRPLNMLNVGDEVQVYTSSGEIRKSRILTVFHHQRPTVRFLDIHTANEIEPLRLTPSHSILTKKNTGQLSSFRYDFASNVNIGDLLLSSNLKPVRVVNIREIILYNQTISTPLTFEGNILTNNLVASCYATYRHTFMHFLSMPVRYCYRLETFSRWNYLLVHFLEFYSKM